MKKMKAVVLAAGKSTRMKSCRSKVTHDILGKPLINYLMDTLIEMSLPPQNIILICGDNQEELMSVINYPVNYAVQKEQLGTAHALWAAEKHLIDFDGDTMVVVGDNPYLNATLLSDMYSYHNKNKSCCTLLTAQFSGELPPYGRIIRDNKGRVLEIMEAIDATKEQLKVREMNASLYLFNNSIVYPLSKKISNKNKKAEYYLTDIISLLNNENREVFPYMTNDFMVTKGINNRWDLSEAINYFNLKKQQDLAVNSGVTFIQPQSTVVEYDVKIGKDTVVYPNSYLSKGTVIGENCVVGPNVYLKNCKIENGEKLSFEKREL